MVEKNFCDKDTYLAYRAAWKAEYLDISEQIRALKELRHDREYGPHAASSLHHVRLSATAMLEQLAEAKVESGLQRAAERREELTTAAE